MPNSKCTIGEVTKMLEREYGSLESWSLIVASEEHRDKIIASKLFTDNPTEIKNFENAPQKVADYLVDLETLVVRMFIRN